MPDFKDTQRQLPPLEHYREMEKGDLQKIADETTKLLTGEKGGDRFLNNVAGVILGSLQTYQVARTALSRRCIELGVTEEVEGWLVQSMHNHSGTEEVTRQQVLSKLKDLVLPFLMAEFQCEGEREQAAVAGDEKSEDASRRQQDVPIGYPASPLWPLDDGDAANGEAVMSRKRPITLVGDPGVIDVCLDRIQRRCLTRSAGFRPNVLRLTTRLKEHNVLHRKGDEKQYFEVGANRWANCGASGSRLRRELTPWLRLLRKHRVDLLIIEDLPLFVGGPERLLPQQRAGQGLRALSRWAEETGCAVVAAVPLEREQDKKASDLVLPPLDGAWSNLEVYSDLVQLGVVESEDEETYILFAQRHGDDSTCEELESAVSKKLIDDWRKSDNTDSGADSDRVHGEEPTRPVADPGRPATPRQLRGGRRRKVAKGKTARRKGKD